MTTLPAVDKTKDLIRILLSNKYMITTCLIYQIFFAYLGYKAGKPLAVAPMMALVTLYLIFIAKRNYTLWKRKWKVIEEPTRRKYAYLWQQQARLYTTQPESEEERENRRQFLEKERASLFAEDIGIELHSMITGSKDKNRVWPRMHLAHVQAEFADAMELIKWELATLSRETQEKRVRIKFRSNALLSSHRID